MSLPDASISNIGRIIDEICQINKIFHPPSSRSGYHHKFIQHLNAVHLPLCLLRYTLSTIQRRASDSLSILVETRAALGVLVAARERLLAINAASGMCVPASSGVCGVGLAVAREGVDEGVGVLACALRFLLRTELVST